MPELQVKKNINIFIFNDAAEERCEADKMAAL